MRYSRPMEFTRGQGQDLDSPESKELEQKRLQLAVFTELGKALTSSLDLNEILRKVMHNISELLRPKVGEGVAGWVAREKRPLLVPDVNKDPRFSKKADEVSNFTTQSIICVPLITRGRCLGVIELITKAEREEGFSEDDTL